MPKRVAVAVAAVAVAVMPLSAPAAQASETHACDVFTQPVGEACDTVLRIFCMLTRDNPVCR